MKRGHAHKDFIKVQKLNKPVEEFDDVPAVWVDHLPEVHTVATIVPTQAGEVVEGQRVQDQVTHKVELRWQPGIESEMRVLIDDQAIVSDDQKRKLHIDSMINVKERSEDLVLLCVEQR